MIINKTYPNRTLNYIELSDLKAFQEMMEEGRTKDLLGLALHNLEEYQKCGSPWDCQDRMEWLQISPEEARKKYNWFVKQAREYIAERGAPKKVGRPKILKECSDEMFKECYKRRVFGEPKEDA